MMNHKALVELIGVTNQEKEDSKRASKNGAESDESLQRLRRDRGARVGGDLEKLRKEKQEATKLNKETSMQKN